MGEVRGRDDVIRAIQEAADTLFRVQPFEAEDLSETTGLLRTAVRRPLAPHGFSEGHLWVLFEIRDGKLWRSRYFATEQEALDAFRG